MNTDGMDDALKSAMERFDLGEFIQPLTDLGVKNTDNIEYLFNEKLQEIGMNICQIYTLRSLKRSFKNSTLGGNFDGFQFVSRNKSLTEAKTDSPPRKKADVGIDLDVVIKKLQETVEELRRENADANASMEKLIRQKDDAVNVAINALEEAQQAKGDAQKAKANEEIAVSVALKAKTHEKIAQLVAQEAKESTKIAMIEKNNAIASLQKERELKSKFTNGLHINSNQCTCQCLMCGHNRKL